MKMKDYWFLAFVRCSNECVFENQLGEQNDSTRLGSKRPPPPPPPPTLSVHVRVFYSL